MADSVETQRPSSRVLPHELPAALRDAGLGNWIREPLDDAVDRRRRIIFPPATAVMGTPASACQGALLAEARHPDTVFMMGDNPALPAMPERPVLRDFFQLRLSKIGASHLLQSAMVAAKRGLDEKVIVACLLHDIAIAGLLSANHGYWGAQLVGPYVDEEVAWAIEKHEALRYFPDESVGYTYPEAYIDYFGPDYNPPEYIRREAAAARQHRWYMTSRLVTINDTYSFDRAAVVDFDEFEDVVGRHFRQPKEGLGFDGSPVAHMWRTMIWPNNFLRVNSARAWEARMVFRIMPHGRLQEWVADEMGYFADERLEYDFVHAGDYGIHAPQRDGAGEIKTGAFETFEAGRDGANVSCACHWATNVAASGRAGQLVTSAYSVAPCAIMVPPESPIRRPEDLAGVAIGVGYHSGSHFATVQALEAVLPAGEVKLTFQGPPNERLDALLEREVLAGTMWGVPLYIAEAFGFRKVLDATFMIGFLVTGSDVSKADVDKYLAALRRAQMEIDLHPERYKHYHRRAVPEKYQKQVDVRTFGTGERIVFLPYTREVFAATQQWTQAHNLFPESPAVGYNEAALV